MKLIPEKGDFGSVHWAALLIYMPTLLGMTWFRSVRWRILLNRIVEIPKTRLLAVSSEGFIAIGMGLLAYACGVTHGDGSAITFGEACTLMGMLGCTILIPGPPGLLGVFQAGIYAGMTMYFPTAIVTGAGSAYVFLLYTTQVLLIIVMAIWGLWYEGGTRRLQGALDSELTLATDLT